jgi:hypothetical protein
LPGAFICDARRGMKFARPHPEPPTAGARIMAEIDGLTAD